MQKFDFDNLPEDQAVYPAMEEQIIIPAGAKEYAEAFLRKEGYIICTDRHKQQNFHFKRNHIAALCDNSAPDIKTDGLFRDETHTSIGRPTGTPDCESSATLFNLPTSHSLPTNTHKQNKGNGREEARTSGLLNTQRETQEKGGAFGSSRVG